MSGRRRRDGIANAGEWRHGTSFGLTDLEALLNVTCEAKGGRSLTRWSAEALQASLRPSEDFPPSYKLRFC
ncbi:hypothetical protein COMA2_20330 [Candidatus Nitrospira nitrificans]|uniref:Uncharacterized protein n=1 Tax=Candidatus Nitrospira nitrificans TaxID=1742973 RepID=A0A0S4LFS2_9BACT|nr:hypothetical protein COMA2_20330 [Candidatus Nitrospira nitrificans]